MLHCAKCINLWTSVVHAHACLPHTHTHSVQNSGMHYVQILQDIFEGTLSVYCMNLLIQHIFSKIDCGVSVSTFVIALLGNKQEYKTLNCCGKCVSLSLQFIGCLGKFQPDDLGLL